MGCPPLGKFGLWVVMVLVQVSGQSSGCFEQERRGLLEFKQFLKSKDLGFDSALSAWVENPKSNCCDWEKVMCNSTTGHVTELSLESLIDVPFYLYNIKFARLNISLFLPFKELRKLNLSYNYFDGWLDNEGFEKLSTLRNLEILDLGYNYFDNNSIFRSLGALTSLKTLILAGNDLGEYFLTKEFEKLSDLRNLEILDLGYNYFNNNSIFRSLGALTSLRTLILQRNDLRGCFPAQELVALRNLETLDIRGNRFHGFEKLSVLRKLETLNLEYNEFNESVLPSLSALTSLKMLHFGDNSFSNGSFPAQELSVLQNLEMLDLRWTELGSLTMQDCKLLSKLSKLRHLDLSCNAFNKDVFRIIGVLPSLKFLSLEWNNIEGPISNQELTYNLSNLEVLLLGYNGLNGTLPMEGLASFRHLEILDLSRNDFSGSIPPSIGALSSLKVLSLVYNRLTGTLPIHQGLCELKRLEELDLSYNHINGSLPPCLSNLRALKSFKLSLNQFTGNIPPSLLGSLNSLEHLDLSHNRFEGLFSFASFANHSKLESVQFMSDNDKFVVETEYTNWVPMFQLKVLVLSNSNLNNFSGKILPKFLLHQNKLTSIDLSHNNLEGSFPNWLLLNNTSLNYLILRNNSFGGRLIFSLPYSFSYASWMDVSDNQLCEQIPANIGEKLQFVGYLNLSKNAFEGDIPSSIDVVFKLSGLSFLDISNNMMSGKILSSVDNMTSLSTVIIRNNSFNGQFPCSLVPSKFMDVSHNLFSGSLHSCSNAYLRVVEHMHLQGNKFTGSIPRSFLNSSNLLALDFSDNNLSGRIPFSITVLSNLRILMFKGNKLGGSIPNQLCQLSKISLMDLSKNSFIGSIPHCFSNITFGKIATTVFVQDIIYSNQFFDYHMRVDPSINGRGFVDAMFGKVDEVEFVTKTRSNSYHGGILNFMSGLDFSCNKLTGEIPFELGKLTGVHALNLSHNHLTGPIPKSFSDLKQIESLDLSYNKLCGKIPTELIDLNFLEVFIVAHNNLSGSLPEMKAQFQTFNAGSYDGNPFLCGPPLEKNCTTIGDPPQSPTTSSKETNGKWYDIDPVTFSASFVAAYTIFLLGFASVLYINPYWQQKFFYLIEEGIYSSYYFVSDALYKLVRRPSL